MAYEQLSVNRFEKYKGLLINLIIILVCLIILIPLAWIVLTSLKSRMDMYAMPPKIFFTPTLEAYKYIFVDAPVIKFMLNTIIVSVFSTGFSLVLGTFAAYGLARYNFRGKEDLAFYILSIRMFPPIAAAIPIFMILKFLGLLDTKVGLIIAYTTFNLPFVVWMMKEFISNIPREIEDAAMLDGYTRMQAFRKITFPLIKPSLIAVAIFCIIFSWNEFLFALLLTSREAVTMPVAITKFITWKEVTWENIMAAATVMIIPVLVFSLAVQKHLVKGLTMGAVRE